MKTIEKPVATYIMLKHQIFIVSKMKNRFFKKNKAKNVFFSHL